MKLSLFVTLCNKFFQKDPKRVSEVFLSHFSIKTVFRIYPDFWANLVQNEIWYLDYFEYTEFNSDVPFFYFNLEIPFFGQIFSKKLKLPIQAEI